ATAADFETTEYFASGTLSVINASSAYARGATGEGIVVAVIDSGVDLDHPDLAANIASGSRDFVDDDFDASPEDQGDFRSHGTHVAGIIAAVKNDSGIHGVAFDSEILALRAGTSDGSLTQADTEAAYSYVLSQKAAGQNIKVVNASYGSIGISSTSIDLIEDITDAGIIFVAASGNAGDADPDFPALLPGLDSIADAGYDFKNRLIAVGCWDDINDRVCQFGGGGSGNNAGVAKNNFIMAPGYIIGSTVDQDDVRYASDYGAESGTSMAAPHVAGGVALLSQLYPYLEPEEIVQLLFDTAVDLGDAGVDEIYGNGLMDLDAAQLPVGTTALVAGSTVDGAKFTLESSKISLSSAFGDALSTGLDGKTLAVFDSYDRAFTVDLGQFAEAAKAKFDMDAALDRFGQPDTKTQFDLPTGTSVAFTTSGGMQVDAFGGTDDARAQNGRDTGFNSFSLTQSFGGSAFSASYNVDPRTQLGLWSEDLVGEDTIIAEDAFASPYLAFVEKSWGTSASVPLSPTTSLNFGAFTGEQVDDATGEDSRTSAAMAEFVYRPQTNLRLGVEFGGMGERGRFLGAETSGAFSTGEETWTGYVGASVSYALSTQFSVLASAYQGFTRAALSEDSLISDMSTIRSESFSLGFVGKQLFAKNDRVTVGVSQPLRVASGTATLDTPTGRDLAGNIISQSVSAGLTPTGREIDLEASYALPLGPSESLTTGAMLRMQPGHTTGAEAEGVGILRYKAKF
ncbi:MAG: S8 family peptidase, partial [Pseudomonadota bacterium]